MSQQPSTKLVVVTGSAGYIGGQTCIELKKQGYEVIGIDNRHNEHLDKFQDEFLQCDFTDMDAFSLYKKVYPVAIIHCAGTSLVGPSMKNPGHYFHNNVSKTNLLLDFVAKHIPKTKIIFSSSASVYGIPTTKTPLRENDKVDPISPYGESKLMVEHLLEWYHRCHKLNFTAFRYFNACGADDKGQHGQEPDASHIFAKLFEAVKNNAAFTLNGADYDTPDGTCIRDYIHVQDIALAHIKAIDNSIQGIYNLGMLQGHSNLQIQMLVEKITNKEIVTFINRRREGDPPSLVADSTMFKRLADWNPVYDMSDILTSLNTWYKSPAYDALTKQRSYSNIQPAL